MRPLNEDILRQLAAERGLRIRGQQVADLVETQELKGVGVHDRQRLDGTPSFVRDVNLNLVSASAGDGLTHFAVSTPEPAAIGTALLGYQLGDEVLWPTPGGVRRLEIIHVEPVAETPAQEESSEAMVARLLYGAK